MAVLCYRFSPTTVDSGQLADMQTLMFRCFKMLDEVHPKQPLPVCSHSAQAVSYLTLQTAESYSPMLTYCKFLPEHTPNGSKQKKVFCQNCSGAHCLSDCVEHASSKISPPSLYVSQWPLHHSVPHRALFHQISPFTFAVPPEEEKDSTSMGHFPHPLSLHVTVRDGPWPDGPLA